MQVADDLSLLATMIHDMGKSPSLFQPSTFWKTYEERLLPELQTRGLHNFRRRFESPLGAFGATDALEDPFQHYHHVKIKFDRLGLDLRKCAIAPFGNPKGVRIIEGRPWTWTQLVYCSLFADAAKYIDFHPHVVFCDLGCGAGRQAEIIARLYDDATVLLYDIPPQLYVANQYLSKIFGERVAGYRDPGGDVKGKIVIRPAWQIVDVPLMDVFWNSASFQEMEPEMVRNYLATVNEIQPRYVYINSLPDGYMTNGKGGLKTSRPVGRQLYIDSLPDYRLTSEYTSDQLDGERYGHHTSYVFAR